MTTLEAYDTVFITVEIYHMLTNDDLKMISKLKALDAAAKAGPWYPQGSKSKDKAVYRVGNNEEQLIIEMRNNITRLLALVEGINK